MPNAVLLCAKRVGVNRLKFRIWYAACRPTICWIRSLSDYHAPKSVYICFKRHVGSLLLDKFAIPISECEKAWFFFVRSIMLFFSEIHEHRPAPARITRLFLLKPTLEMSLTSHISIPNLNNFQSHSVSDLPELLLWLLFPIQAHHGEIHPVNRGVASNIRLFWHDPIGYDQTRCWSHGRHYLFENLDIDGFVEIVKNLPEEVEMCI